MKKFFHLPKPLSPLLAGASLLGMLMLAPVPTSLRPIALGGTAAYAQSAVSNQEIQSYARSMLEIEPLRQAAYDQIKRITGADVPPIMCNRPESLNRLSREVRQIAVNYCNRSVQIAAGHGLPAARFNAITVALQNDPDLATRIQEAMVQIQRNR